MVLIANIFIRKKSQKFWFKKSLYCMNNFEVDDRLCYICKDLYKASFLEKCSACNIDIHLFCLWKWSNRPHGKKLGCPKCKVGQKPARVFEEIEVVGEQQTPPTSPCPSPPPVNDFEIDVHK